MSSDVVSRWKNLIEDYIPALDELRGVKNGARKLDTAEYKNLLKRCNRCLGNQHSESFAFLFNRQIFDWNIRVP